MFLHIDAFFASHRFIDWVQYSQGSLLAKDGKCKPFDAHADGCVACQSALSSF